MHTASALESAAETAVIALLAEKGLPTSSLWSTLLVDFYVCPRTLLLSHTLQLAYCSETHALGRSAADAIRELVESELPARLGLSLRTEKAGGKVVAMETYTTGDRDFAAQLTKIRETAPDIIYLPAPYNDTPLIAAQARQLGIKAPFLGSDAWSSPDIIKLDTGKSLEGSYFCNHYSTEAPNPKAKQFIADYTAMITAFKDLPSSPRYSRLLSRPLI
jgi:hypothetical protein